MMTLILDPERNQAFELKNMIQETFEDQAAVHIVDSPAELYRACVKEPADVVFARPCPGSEEGNEQNEFIGFHHALDGLHARYPWIQILLLLEENLESIRMLRRRDERFLFYPYQKSSVKHIIQESLGMEKQIRDSLMPQNRSTAGERTGEPGQNRFLSLVESRENTAVLRRELDRLNVSFGWGFACVLEEGTDPAALKRVHEEFQRKDWRIFEKNSEEGRAVLLIGARMPSGGADWLKQMILDDYTRKNIMVYGAAITESLSQLSPLLVEARTKYMSHERYTPLLWTQQAELEAIGQNWAYTVALSNLTGRRDDILALNRHQAKQIAGMPFRDQVAVLQIAKMNLEEQMNRIYDLQTEKMELHRLPENLELIDEKTLFSWLLLWSDQAFMTADVYASQSHIRYLMQIYQAILARFHEKDFNLEKLSGQLGLSAGYICTLMKKYTPYSFVDYLNQCRVYYAMALLETDLLIKNVASQAGFQSSTYLGRVFKSIMGITPGEYRRNYQKNLLHREKQEQSLVSGH